MRTTVSCYMQVLMPKNQSETSLTHNPFRMTNGTRQISVGKDEEILEEI